MKKTYKKKAEKLIRKMEICLGLCEKIVFGLDFLDPTEVPGIDIQKHRNNFEHRIKEISESINLIKEDIQTAKRVEIKDIYNLIESINHVSKLDEYYTELIPKLMYIVNKLSLSQI